jgi:hypothetical protein
MALFRSGELFTGESFAFPTVLYCAKALIDSPIISRHGVEVRSRLGNHIAGTGTVTLNA